MKLNGLIISMALLVIAAPQAEAQLKLTESDNYKLYMNLATVGTLQTLDHQNVVNAQGTQLGGLEPGFQTSFGDLGFGGTFGKNDELELYFDLYLASRNHASQTYGNEGYLVLRGIPENMQNLRFLQPIFDRVTVKAGHFQLNFGDHLMQRSNNAIVQKNPLVGNFVLDPELVSVGMEVFSKPSRLNWLVGVSNGTNTEDWAIGRGVAYHAKVWTFPVESLRTSVSYFNVDHSSNGPRAQGGSVGQMFSGNRGGERYAGVLGGGQAPGQILAGAGKKVEAYQVDLTWENDKPLKLYGHYGMAGDHDTNGSMLGEPCDMWNYYAAQAAWYFTPAIYAAGRYSAAVADELASVASDGRVDRIQFGGGFWITRNLLMKAEYVTQKYRDFAPGVLLNNNIQAWRNPSFKGVVMEVSFAF